MVFSLLNITLKSLLALEQRDGLGINAIGDERSSRCRVPQRVAHQ